jgi:hypothetical protein
MTLMQNLPVKGLRGRCLRPPPLLGFCLGWSSNLVGSESVVRYRLLNLMKTWRKVPLQVNFLSESARKLFTFALSQWGNYFLLD